jgi:dipeptidyl-peptidase 4
LAIFLKNNATFMKKQTLVFLLNLITISSFSQKETKLPLTLESIWSGYFDQKDIHPHLLNTKPAVAFLRADKATNFEGILTLDMTNGKIIDTIFTNQTKVETGETPTTFAFFEDFDFSPDDSKILIKTERQGIYHTSYREFAYIWNAAKKTLKPVSTDGKISYPSFNASSNMLAYVRDANLYITNLETEKTITVTSDGAAGSIINAMADEVYEDGFGLSKMYEWNAQGTKIAFIKINQGFVKKYPVISYEKAEPTISQKVFAKPGESISEASIYIYDIKGNYFTKLDLGGIPNQYITNFKWHTNGESIFVERLDRHQQKLEVIQCNMSNGNILKIVLTEESKQYVKTNLNNIVMHPTKNSFLWLSERSSYNHIYNVDVATGATTPITTGKWEVKEIVSYDEAKQTIYFTGNQSGAMQNHLYKIKEDGKGLDKLTNNRGWHYCWLSADNKYFFDKSTTINSPSSYKIFSTSGKEITNTAIIENKRYQENTKGFDINDCKPFSFTNSTGSDIKGWIINGDKTPDAKKKPLLLYVYGGNNKQEVTEEWNDRMAMTFRYFANKGFTIACIDPSGSYGYGVEFRNKTINNLADIAVKDLIQAKDYLIKNNNVDASKTALMGWSYGGYLTTMAATKFGGSFTKYIAIAPVTNWRDYNAAYTERLLQMPSDNPEVYKNQKPEEYISTYKGGLLLVQGSTDDNVHLQHTMRLAKALSESDTYYDIQIFTDKGHALSDGIIDKTRMNLYQKILKFLQRNEVN